MIRIDTNCRVTNHIANKTCRVANNVARVLSNDVARSMISLGNLSIAKRLLQASSSPSHP